VGDDGAFIGQDTGPAMDAKPSVDVAEEKKGE